MKRLAATVSMSSACGRTSGTPGDGQVTFEYLTYDSELKALLVAFSRFTDVCD